jgi:hypothetical protein
VARWWDSIATMRRLSRTLAAVAVIGLLVGVGAWSVTLAITIPALVVATGAVLGALFTWFRLDHLRELERLGR